MDAYFDWLSGGVAVLALIISIVAYVGSNREAKRARSEAARSADAAERSAAAEERVLALTEAEAERSDVGWEVIRAKGDGYVLKNTGQRSSAYRVLIDGETVQGATPRP